MEIIYVTTNSGKVESLRKHLEPHGIQLVQRAIELPEPRFRDVKRIAEHKALKAYEQVRKPLLVLDAGFYINPLNGFPGTFVNFALETIGLEGILKLVEGKERSCQSRECLAYIDEGTAIPVCFTSFTDGTLADRPLGEMQKHLWSPLGRIFIPKGYDKTPAQMTPQEYALYSMRKPREGSYHKQFIEWYLEHRKID